MAGLEDQGFEFDWELEDEEEPGLSKGKQEGQAQQSKSASPEQPTPQPLAGAPEEPLAATAQPTAQPTTQQTAPAPAAGGNPQGGTPRAPQTPADQTAPAAPASGSDDALRDEPGAQPIHDPFDERLPDSGEIRDKLAAAGVSDLFQVRVLEHLIEVRQLRFSELDDFLVSAKESGVSPAELAAERDLIGESEVLGIRARLSGMEIVLLDQVEVEEDLAQLIKPEQAAEWQALPYSRSDLGELLVAIANPDDPKVRDDIQKALPREEVRFRLAKPRELALYIERIYDPEGSARVSEIVAEAEAAESGEDSEGEDYVVRGSEEAPIVQLVDRIVDQASELGASDIHIEPRELDAVVRFRVDGVLREVTKISKRQYPKIVARIKTMASMRTDEHRIPQDGRVQVKGRPLDLRIVTVPTIWGEQVTMRLLDASKAMLTLEQLGMSKQNLERYMEGIASPHGCCFITGPTGSGKSTTLYSSLSAVVTPEKKLISIEDPVEYRLAGITQIDVSAGRLVAENVNKMTFANALRAILRSDPDIVMVGEIRDTETAKIAIDAALTGHFLYSTVHTNDAISAITRLEQLGVERFLIAEATRVIVAQRLLRLLCNCKVEFELTKEVLGSVEAPAWMYEWLEKAGGRHTIYKPSSEGCARCSGMGYKGRTGVHEVILVNEELRTAIVNDAQHEEMERIARAAGMDSLADDAYRKVWSGETSLEEVARVVV